MMWLIAIAVSFIAWLVWIPAAAMQSAARGHSGSVSVFPVIPVFPLVAWGIVYWTHRADASAAVAGAHTVLLAALLVSIARRKARHPAETKGQRGMTANHFIKRTCASYAGWSA